MRWAKESAAVFLPWLWVPYPLHIDWDHYLLWILFFMVVTEEQTGKRLALVRFPFMEAPTGETKQTVAAFTDQPKPVCVLNERSCRRHNGRVHLTH